MSERPVIFWFRDDLRLADNPGLAAAVASGKPVVSVYVLDDESREARPMGAACRWWLDKSLAMLGERIAEGKPPDERPHLPACKPGRDSMA